MHRRKAIMGLHSGWLRGALLFIALACAPLNARAQAVLTYHDNTMRTGWNAKEQTLNVANVGGGGFGLLAMTALDSQVDAQPLVVPRQVIAGRPHTVVYVVTGGDTLYAIDGITGAILASRNFGTPVPESALPGGCDNNGPTVGITSTPVIDPLAGTLYLIADTYENNTAVMRVHAVSLRTLQDKIAPVIVSASAQLADGSVYRFNASVSRQRAALLLEGGKLYAGFSSYCDQDAATSRGWLLGWTASTLTPLAHNQLEDAVPTLQSGYFLNSIWMSGAGPASAGPDQDIFIVSSNSDKNTYGAANLDESLLDVSPDLSVTDAFYTAPNRARLDQDDGDFGSGGAMLAPGQPGENPQLLFAAGKSGTMYMFSRSRGAGLGLLGSYAIGGCWCAPSYFTGPDGVGRVITSGGGNAIIWAIDTSDDAAATLTQLATTSITTGQDPGFFTTVSSAGLTPGSAVIWAVGRPTSAPGTMPLYAIDPSTGDVIYTATAGNWVSGNSDADTVPTVAAGHVYVASYQELAIFGLSAPPANLGGRGFDATMRRQAARAQPGFALGAGQHALWGLVLQAAQNDMILKLRSGALVRVDMTAARAAGNVAAPVAGEAAIVIGRFAAGGSLVASHVEHAKAQSTLWPRDQ
jgi:hypothetical protein